MNSPTILCFRNDLRLGDNPALQSAVQRGGGVIPVFIWDPSYEGVWPFGSASKWWLHQSLHSLNLRLVEAGSRLIFRLGPTLETLRALVKETGAEAVFWNHRYEPAVVAQDAKVMTDLGQDGLRVESFKSTLLFEPSTIKNKLGRPFQVFTPFWRHCLAQTAPPSPSEPPNILPSPHKWPKSLALGDLELEPRLGWAQGLCTAWKPGEANGRTRLQEFLGSNFVVYGEQRNRPDLNGTSRLSPHLHFGEVSPRQIWHGLRQLTATRGWHEAEWRESQFLNEIGWREFAHHLLHHFPLTPEQPYRAEFAHLLSSGHRDWLHAWQRGATGYPIVDAGMRELWRTGWMHNRVRMIVASFLVKDLQLSWQEGAAWFWDTLVDADLANNTLGWQWTAGCGVDASPYFRVFNPVSQGEKFDPQGEYVRHWCPEIARLPDAWLHCPWEAPHALRLRAGIELGVTYPNPIVNHANARELALKNYAGLRLKFTG